MQERKICIPNDENEKNAYPMPKIKRICIPIPFSAPLGRSPPWDICPPGHSSPWTFTPLDVRPPGPIFFQCHKEEKIAFPMEKNLHSQCKKETFAFPMIKIKTSTGASVQGGQKKVWECKFFLFLALGMHFFHFYHWECKFFFFALGMQIFFSIGNAIFSYLWH